MSFRAWSVAAAFAAALLGSACWSDIKDQEQTTGATDRGAAGTPGAIEAPPPPAGAAVPGTGSQLPSPAGAPAAGTPAPGTSAADARARDTARRDTLPPAPPR